MLPRVVIAQRVHGEVRSAPVGRGVADASVALVNSLGELVTVRLTDENGRYQLSAPRPGSYRVRVRHIGFAPDSSSELRLDAALDVEYCAWLVRLATTLATVRTVQGSRCTATTAAGATTLRLWEEAQSALSSTIAASLSGRLGYVIRHVERELDPEGARSAECARGIRARWQPNRGAASSLH
jgi:hypothetical protein